jgi:hypothetical protein
MSAVAHCPECGGTKVYREGCAVNANDHSDIRFGDDIWCDDCETDLQRVDYLERGSSVGGGHWIVVALFTEPDSGATTVDEEWHVYESYTDALEAYDSVVENGAYSASICAVVRSTDYDPHPNLLEVTQ